MSTIKIEEVVIQYLEDILLFSTVLRTLCPNIVHLVAHLETTGEVVTPKLELEPPEGI